MIYDSYEAISITIPYQNHWNMTHNCYGQFPLQFLMKYDLWQIWEISITIPYQNHWNMMYDCCGPFPLQFLIKIIEIWLMTAMGHFLYNSLSKSLKYDLWQLWIISITIPYQNHGNMTYDCYGPFPYNSLSKSLKYDPWLLCVHLSPSSREIFMPSTKT